MERCVEQERGAEEGQRAEQDEQPVVVERLGAIARQSPSARCREVREVVERDLRDRRIRLGRRIPALEPGVAIVVPVGVLAVEDQVAGDLDLVRRVVDVVPRLGRVAQADLEEGRRQDQ